MATNRTRKRWWISSGAGVVAAFAALAARGCGTQRSIVDVGCATPCATGQSCVEGRCVDASPAACAPACDPMLETCVHGVCQPLGDGGCSPACGAGQMCALGGCVEAICNPDCTPPQFCSGGTCLDPACSPPCAEAQVCSNRSCAAAACAPSCAAGTSCVRGACLTAGMLRVTLTWDIPDDLSLHVVAPAGTDLSRINPTGEGGRLEHTDSTGTGPESVVWDAAPASGTYVVCVTAVTLPHPPVNFQVTVNRPGMASQMFTGARSMGTGVATCSRTAGDFVGMFTIP